MQTRAKSHVQVKSQVIVWEALCFQVKKPQNTQIPISESVFIWEMFPLGWKLWSTFSSQFDIIRFFPLFFFSSALSGTFHTACC